MSSSTSSNTLLSGTAVRLPDNTIATVRAREIGGATYAVDVRGVIQRGWTREQLREAAPDMSEVWTMDEWAALQAVRP